MLNEKIELLGKGLYENIPDQLTLKAMPTCSELDYVGSEDFDNTMISTILPQCVEEKINFNDLLEIDYQWICRCLRMLNFGPYHTTNSIFCSNCKTTSYGEYRVDLRTIACKVLPDGFKNDIVIPRDNFIDFNKDIHIKLPTIRQVLNSASDKAFQGADGTTNRKLARMCYMITTVGTEAHLTPIEIKLIVERELCAADYRILQGVIDQLTDYGLRAGGTTVCPKCGSPEAAFLALMDDRFFRCTLDDLRRWRDDKRAGNGEDVLGFKKTTV